MNILYLTTHLNIGGITSYILTLARGLKKKGHNLYIASSGGEVAFEFTKEGIMHFVIPIKTKQEISPKILFSYFKLKTFIKENDIEIIHSHTRVTQVLGALLSRSSKVSHLSTCHGFFKKRLSRMLFACWGKKVIAISEQVKRHLVDDFKVQEDQIKVIHSGIDINKFSAKKEASVIVSKKRLGLKNGPVIGIVARLSDVKGHSYLIEAISLVLNEFPDAQLFIVGEGPMKEKLADLTRVLKIEEKVYFHQNVSDTTTVLSAMDIFVMPSLNEGLGLSLMEAMAFGLPVIGSSVGGIKTLIQNGVNGLLVTSADPGQLAEAVKKLLRDPVGAKILGEKARIFIKDNFAQESMVKYTEEVYSECLNG